MITIMTKTINMGDDIDYAKLNSQPRLTISQERQAGKHWTPEDKLSIVDYSESDCGVPAMDEPPPAPPHTRKLHR
jgi:hypothetical protein